MSFRKANWCLITLILVALAYPSFSTHVRTIEIQVNRNDCSSLAVDIKIVAYVNYFQTNVQIGGTGTVLRFGDGTELLISNEMGHEIIDPELHVGRVEFTIQHNYPSYGRYTISFTEENRNLGILNFDGSGVSAYYTETSILLEPGICNTSARLLIPPVDRACSGVAYYHNAGAIDREDDSLSFELVIPKQGLGLPVSNYLVPQEPKFYAGISYNEANEERDGPPMLTIDPVDGTLTWDAPGSPGEYGIAIKVREWKYNPVDSIWYETGYVIRDMQIIVEECTNQKPQLTIPLELCVIAGSVVQFDVPASDPDHDDVVIEAFSEVFDLAHNKATINPENGIRQSTNPPHDTASVHFSWVTSCEHVKVQPYNLVLKISDRPTTGPRLVRFYTVNIKVIAPAPEYESVSINPVSKKVTLQWKDYPCENAEAFQVWRRISEVTYEQPECNIGMPYFLRYQLIGEVPATVFSYTDNDLSFGAQYCYRIVALVGGKKVPGRLSLDTCLIPKPAEAPVVINVSVQTTSTQSGEILIRWTKPFDIDRQQYPPPYQYKVFRKIEGDPQSVFQTVTPATISDTVFTDTEINTQENIYRYQIELYVPSLTNSPLDSSSEASSVFSSAQPVFNGIDLKWEAATPWYNYSQTHPYHLIYRSDSPSGPFVLIDSTDVNETDFHYRDLGQYKGIGLSGDLYYYKVMTRGTYGNPKIISPLENFSQITSGQILDTIPPCQPLLSIAKIDCSEFACDGSDYYTKLEWQTSGTACEGDVIAYEVLVKEEDSDAYTSLGTVTGKTFVHSNLNSLNKCYRLISLDRSGNRSDSSAVVCNSNCAVFKLPNVITPGVKDQHNDFLTTYPGEDSYRKDCSRSVRQVDIKIFSRWGEEIFTTTVNDADSRVFWNGLNKKGVEVSAGTYYYHAKVIFDTHDSGSKNQQIKGWVQVIR